MSGLNSRAKALLVKFNCTCWTLYPLARLAVVEFACACGERRDEIEILERDASWTLEQLERPNAEHNAENWTDTTVLSLLTPKLSPKTWNRRQMDSDSQAKRHRAV